MSDYSPVESDQFMKFFYDNCMGGIRNTIRDTLNRTLAAITSGVSTGDPVIDAAVQQINDHFISTLLESVGITNEAVVSWDEATKLVREEVEKQTLAEVKRACQKEADVEVDGTELKKENIGRYIGQLFGYDLLRDAGFEQPVESWDRAKQILRSTVGDELNLIASQAESIISIPASALGVDCRVGTDWNPAKIQECLEKTKEVMNKCGDVAQRTGRKINDMTSDVKSVFREMSKKVDTEIRKTFESVEDSGRMQKVVNDFVAVFTEFADGVEGVARGLQTKPNLTIPDSVRTLCKERADKVKARADELQRIIESQAQSLCHYHPFEDFAIAECVFEATPASVELSTICEPFNKMLKTAEDSWGRENTLREGLESKKEEARKYFDEKTKAEANAKAQEEKADKLDKALDSAKDTQWIRLSMQRSVYESQLKRLEAFYKSRLPQ